MSFQTPTCNWDALYLSHFQLHCRKNKQANKMKHISLVKKKKNKQKNKKKNKKNKQVSVQIREVVLAIKEEVSYVSNLVYWVIYWITVSVKSYIH